MIGSHPYVRHRRGTLRLVRSVRCRTTTQTSTTDSARLLTPAEVASLFRVDVKTVTRWANSGLLGSIRTLGEHRRFDRAEVHTLLNGTRIPRQAHAS